MHTYKANGEEDKSIEINAELLNVTNPNIQILSINQSKRWIEINLSYPGEGDIKITCDEYVANVHFISQ